MRVSHVWEERGEGRTSGMASEVCMDKDMSKSRLQDHPYHLNKQKCKPRNKDWAIMLDSSKK